MLVDTRRRCTALPRTARWPALATLMVAAGCSSETAQVTFERLAAARQDSANWITYSGAYDGQRFSALDQIDRSNVGQLLPAWEFPMETGHPVETSPIVVDGTMFITRPPGDVVALDAGTGGRLWEYHHPLPEGITTCCGLVNRGLGVLGHTLYFGTLDAQLVAIDAHTGKKQWQVEVADWKTGYRITSAPLMVRDLVIVGIAQDTRQWKWAEPGSPPMLRGRLDAYDAATGALRWRFYTTPVKGEPGSDTWAGDTWTVGGGSTWLTGSYDHELDLIYWGVGAPSAYSYGDLRPGDNLYTSSIVALDASLGTLKWHFQFTPHDLHDWDAAQIPVLADLEIGGRPRKALLTANRNGFFYALDRQTGEFLLAQPFARQTWASGVDTAGRPIRLPVPTLTEKGYVIAPTSDGAATWWSPSYSPRTGLFYVNSVDATERVYLVRHAPAGEEPHTTIERMVNVADKVSVLRALDPSTGAIRWEVPSRRSSAGVLTTAGDLLFTGNTDSDVLALDAVTGKVLWKHHSDGWFHAAPVTYLVDGRQHVVISSNKTLRAFALPE